MDDDITLMLDQLPVLITSPADSSFWIKATRFMINFGKLNEEELKKTENLIRRQSSKINQLALQFQKKYGV
ncbi:MAG TPA: hypothetical protein PLI65_05735 [Bacteroidales bacterium]|nr:hypothetical protein [Bacteroidales bacterium]HPR57724.1 hypothetical protein [Bacteroidales bacterium]HRW96763.1 hypothetical protein [Bacteroidales bacterium]